MIVAKRSESLGSPRRVPSTVGDWPLGALAFVVVVPSRCSLSMPSRTSDSGARHYQLYFMLLRLNDRAAPAWGSPVRECPLHGDASAA